MFQSNKNVAKGVVAQLLLEEQEYRNKLYASDEYVKFTVTDENTSKFDAFEVELKELETKREKLRKELAKLDERQKEINTEIVKTLVGKEDEMELYYWSDLSPAVAKQRYIRKIREAKFDSHEWYPDRHTLNAIVLGQIESGNFSTFDEIVSTMRTKYQK